MKRESRQGRSQGAEYEPLRREYARMARGYESRWKRYVEASVRETMRRLPLAPDLRVLDVGCGTGALLAAIRLTEPETRLTGVDLSDEMLELARRRLGPKVDLRRSLAEELPFDDGGFDIVVSSSVLHFVRDPAAAIAHMRRVLAPEGSLVITDWCADYWTCRILDRVLRLSSGGHFRTYRTDELRALLGAAGFTNVHVEHYRIDWFWGLMTATARKG